MLLIGKANWWFPKSLDRLLPHIGFERSRTAASPDEGVESGPGDGARDLVSV
jgi:hypothetical protein